MTDQPPQSSTTLDPIVNKPAQDAVDLIENITQEGETAVEAAIIAAAPVMGTPILKTIWEAAFDWLIKLVLRPVAMLGGRVVIELEEYIALKKSASAQAALDAAKKSGDAHAVSQASDAVDQAVAGVIQYVGATHTE